MQRAITKVYDDRFGALWIQTEELAVQGANHEQVLADLLDRAVSMGRGEVDCLLLKIAGEAAKDMEAYMDKLPVV